MAVARHRLVAGLRAAQPQKLIDVSRSGARPGSDDQLDGVQRAGADLDLLGRAVLDQLLAFDPADQPRFELEDPVEPEHVRHEVVREHGQPREVGELRHPGPGQVRRRDLRALQEREIDRLGGAAPVKVNVRILATTNRDLPAEVKRGTFREDLYFRLNVVSLWVPPLRDRPGDIAALAAHFARRYAEVNGLPPRPLSRAAHLRLAGHGWRGNVRELENTIHRAVLLAQGPEIGADVVETGNSPAAPAAASASDKAAGVASLVGRRVEEVERDLILETLAHTLGNRTHAATILGISIRALRNKLRDYAAQGVRVTPPAAGLVA